MIDDVEDIYVLNGLYRNLLADKRLRDDYDKERAAKAESRQPAKR